MIPKIWLPYCVTFFGCVLFLIFSTLTFIYMNDSVLFPFHIWFSTLKIFYTLMIYSGTVILLLLLIAIYQVFMFFNWHVFFYCDIMLLYNLLQFNTEIYLGHSG